MPFETINIEEINKARRKAIAASIRTISVEELKALGERLFPFIDDPWQERFFEFISEYSGATFYHAATHDGVELIYCHGKEKGVWFMPGTGMGPMQPKGLTALKQIVEGRQVTRSPRDSQMPPRTRPLARPASPLETAGRDRDAAPPRGAAPV
jgi:hypothetical protein